jgi:hypothetical protein
MSHALAFRLWMITSLPSGSRTMAPFRYGPPARLVDGYWVWHTWRDYGFGDRIEARVKFALDGSNPKADVYFVARLPQPLHLP